MGNYPSSYAWPEVENRKNLTYGLTEVRNECFEYSWTVKNFSQLEQTSEGVTSSEFSGGKDIDQNWVLVLNPKKKFDYEDWIGVYLKYVGPQKISANFKISITLNGSTVEKASLQSQEFTKGHVGSGFPNIIKYPKKVENDQIVIGCKILLKNVVSQNQIVDEKYSKLMIPHEKNFEKFRSDFRKLLKSPEEQGFVQDLSILVDGRDFKVHKTILSARSPVFSRLLSTLDEAQAEIIIDDCIPESVESMLEYIYSGETKIGQNVLELFYISDKFELSDLKAECEVELVKSLKFENALQLLDIGDKFNAPLLKSQSMDFIIQNDEEISNYPGFKENLENNNQLSVKILNAVLLNKIGKKS